MIIRTKLNLLLISVFVLGLTSSCDPKKGGEGSGGESTEEVSIDRKAALEEAKKWRSSQEEGRETESYTEETEAVEEQPSASEPTIAILDEAPSKGRGTWDPNTQMYEDNARHLFWDLSFFKTWNLFDGVKLNKNMLFVAEADNGVLVSVDVFPLDKSKKITSIWEILKDQFMERVMKVQNNAFKKSVNQDPVINKVNFRNRSAYEITFKADIPDHRNGQKKVTVYKIRMVTMVNDNEMIELEVMAPQSVIDGRYGDDIFNFLLGKFNFLD